MKTLVVTVLKFSSINFIGLPCTQRRTFLIRIQKQQNLKKNLQKIELLEKKKRIEKPRQTDLSKSTNVTSDSSRKKTN